MEYKNYLMNKVIHFFNRKKMEFRNTDEIIFTAQIKLQSLRKKNISTLLKEITCFSM